MPERGSVPAEAARLARLARLARAGSEAGEAGEVCPRLHRRECAPGVPPPEDCAPAAGKTWDNPLKLVPTPGLEPGTY